MESISIPYSIGLEVECGLKSYIDNSDISTIDLEATEFGLLNCDINSSEQRFRIKPNHIEGIYYICNILNKYCLFNRDSGIHYHVDFTDCFNLLTQEIINEVKDEALAELDTWQYEGTYNDRKISEFGYTGSDWIRFQKSFKTMEIRIGEMTFTPDIMLNRIHSCIKVADIFKNKIKNIKPEENLNRNPFVTKIITI